jgi:hypothetical protein
MTSADACNTPTLFCWLNNAFPVAKLRVFTSHVAGAGTFQVLAGVVLNSPWDLRCKT